MALTLRQIDAFRAVMMTGTLTEAAIHLGISQPAISRLISDMEEEIGYSLFERTGRRVVPTSEAEELVEDVKRALIGLDQIREAAHEIEKFRSARLRLLTTPQIAASVAVDLIARFTRHYPETFVSLEVRNPDSAIDWVMAQQCDIGIFSEATESAACKCEALAPIPVHCIVPRDHRLAALPVVRPTDLDGEIFISYKPDLPLRGVIDGIFEKTQAARLLRYEGRTPEMIAAMVASGMGVALVALQGDVSAVAHRLVHIPFEPAVRCPVSLVWSKHRPLPVMAEAFVAIAMDRHGK